MPLIGRRTSQFERFAAAEGPGLVKLAYVVCGDRERAQDAAQEALVPCYVRWTRLVDPLAYARRAAVNATRDDWRRQQRSDRAYESVARIATTAARVEDPHQLVPERDALLTALDALPHHQRAVVVLRYFSGLTEGETAVVLAIPLGTVKSQTARALARMRETLTDVADPTLQEITCI